MIDSSHTRRSRIPLGLSARPRSWLKRPVARGGRSRNVRNVDVRLRERRRSERGWPGVSVAWGGLRHEQKHVHWTKTGSCFTCMFFVSKKCKINTPAVTRRGAIHGGSRGALVTSTHLGTKHHPFVTPGMLDLVVFTSPGELHRMSYSLSGS